LGGGATAFWGTNRDGPGKSKKIRKKQDGQTTNHGKEGGNGKNYAIGPLKSLGKLGAVAYVADSEAPNRKKDKPQGGKKN